MTQTSSASEDDGLRLDARTIPMPRTISGQAQAFLATLSDAPRFGGLVAETVEGWKAIVAQGDQMMAARAAATGARFKGNVERHVWDGAVVYEITPDEIAPRNAARALFYLHGGAYLFGGGELAAAMALEHAQEGKCKVFSVDYRMPPDHLFPTALDDATGAFRRVIQRYESRNVGMIGFSAGGGLAAASVLKLRDEGHPLPGALVLLSPEADLTEAGDSFRASVYPISFAAINAMYANGHDLKSPYLSPLYGDFSRGFPPTLLTTGTRDFFLSVCASMHRKLLHAEVPCELHMWEAMPHGGFGGSSPEDGEVLRQQLSFLDKYLGRG